MGTPLFYEYSAHYDRGDGIEKEGDGGRDGRRWNEVLLFFLMCLLRFPEKVLVCAA